jgi:DnaJ-class molecular chaperone
MIDDIVLSINVSLDDLYYHRIKRITFNRFRNSKNEKKVLFISLLNYELLYRFQNQGDEDKDVEGCYGDVVILLEIEEHPLFLLDVSLDKYDLWVESEIDIYEYYFGKSLCLKLLNGDEKEVHIEKFDQTSMSYIIKNEGLPFYIEKTDTLVYGDINIIFRLKLKPMKVEYKNKIEEIKNVLSLLR